MTLKWNQVGVAFLIGLTVGVLVGGSSFCRDLTRKWDKQPRHERMLNKFSDRLSLTDEQRTQVKAIMHQKRSKMGVIYTEMRPRFEQVRNETSDEIRKILTPEQQQKFEEFEAEKRERFRKGRARRP
jgi:Spy/CpxP family protein refolding chaperone